MRDEQSVYNLYSSLIIEVVFSVLLIGSCIFVFIKNKQMFSTNAFVLDLFENRFRIAAIIIAGVSFYLLPKITSNCIRNLFEHALKINPQDNRDIKTKNEAKFCISEVKNEPVKYEYAVNRIENRYITSYEILIGTILFDLYSIATIVLIYAVFRVVQLGILIAIKEVIENNSVIISE